MPFLQRFRLDRDPRMRNGSSARMEMCGIDPEEYTGFAFGVGLERIALSNTKSTI